MASRYRKRGLDKPRGRWSSSSRRSGLEGATVLEIGGGVGEIQIELLKRGAARATNLELSPAYDAEARRLLHEAGLEERVERRLHDIAADPEASSRPTSSCCTASSAATPTTSASSAPPPSTRGARRLQLPAAEPRLAARSSRPRTSSSGCAEASSARSRIRRRRCSACSATAACGATFAHRGLVWQVAGLER